MTIEEAGILTADDHSLDLVEWPAEIREQATSLFPRVSKRLFAESNPLVTAGWLLLACAYPISAEVTGERELAEKVRVFLKSLWVQEWQELLVKTMASTWEMSGCLTHKLTEEEVESLKGNALALYMDRLRAKAAIRAFLEIGLLNDDRVEGWLRVLDGTWEAALLKNTGIPMVWLNFINERIADLTYQFPFHT